MAKRRPNFEFHHEAILEAREAADWYGAAASTPHPDSNLSFARRRPFEGGGPDTGESDCRTEQQPFSRCYSDCRISLRRR